MRKKLSPLEKEWIKVEKQEQAYMEKRMEKKDSRLNQLLEKKIPHNLQNTLDAAFSKAFYLIFEKGTGIIEKTYRRDELEKTYQINEFTAHLHGNRCAVFVLLFRRRRQIRCLRFTFCILFIKA